MSVLIREPLRYLDCVYSLNCVEHATQHVVILLVVVVARENLEYAGKISGQIVGYSCGHRRRVEMKAAIPLTSVARQHNLYHQNAFTT